MSQLREIAIRLAFLFAAVWLADPAHATVGPPVKIRWGGGPVPIAVAGQELRGSFEIVAGADGELADLELVGDGWVTTLESPPAMRVRQGEVRRFAFRATPRDPAAPLELRANFDGAPVARAFQLDGPSLAKAAVPSGVGYRSADGPRLSGDRARKNQTLHFFGRMTYNRDDNAVLGVDGLRVRVMDEDTIDSEEIWSGQTDAQGHFNVTVQWDDCDITGCDDPDLYLIFQATGPVTTLRSDNVGEAIYEWTTGVINDFAGSEVNFGVMMPEDPGTNGAMQVYTSLVRASRLAAADGGMTAPMIESRWPDTGDRSYYNGLELHIGSSSTWSESITHHEFGHHLSQSFATMLPTNYNNGFCDLPSPGHCVWCPENVTDAWQEGWADWFGGYVTRQYPSLYGVTPLSINDTNYTLETPLLCNQDGLNYPNALTEGYVGALLRDIEDATDDDHDGGGVDCDIDALSLGPDEILTVMRDDDPTTVAQFITSFRNRFPQHDGGLWSTTRNVTVAFGFPTPTPAITSQPQTCANYRYGDPVVLSVTGNGPNLQYQWGRSDGPLYGAQFKYSSVTLGPLTAGSAGDYSCVVSSCDGTLSVTSNVVRLRVFGGPASPLISWGENAQAQAGIGNYVLVVPPVAPGLPDLIAVDGGRHHLTGIRGNGDVHTWGSQQFGELGNNGAAPAVTTPTRINGISDAVAVAAGSYFTLVVCGDGSVRGFGQNIRGQLGDLTYTDRPGPVMTQIPGCVVDIAAGWYFSLLLTGDGQVYACGDNDKGQLGNGAQGSFTATPTPIAGLDDCIAVAAAGQTSYALKSDGSVWAWGQNNTGQLGNGTTALSTVPVHVGSTSNMRSIAAGLNNGYAIEDNGTAWAWGAVSAGQIGDPLITGVLPQLTPTPIPSLAQVVKIDVTDNLTTLALLQDGRVMAWGRNSSYECFGAPTPTFADTPIPVPGISNIKGLGASFATVFAFGHLGTASDVAEPAAPILPTTLSLRSSPNPFVGRTSLSLALPESGHATVRIFDVAGRLVRTVMDEPRRAGPVAVDWDGRDDDGAKSAAGIYLVRLQVGDRVVSGKVLRLE
jgi:alpha-tubulin suppressor-like RCC1 family protein